MVVTLEYNDGDVGRRCGVGDGSSGGDDDGDNYGKDGDVTTR